MHAGRKKSLHGHKLLDPRSVCAFVDKAKAKLLFFFKKVNDNNNLFFTVIGDLSSIPDPCGVAQQCSSRTRGGGLVAFS